MERRNKEAVKVDPPDDQNKRDRIVSVRIGSSTNIKSFEYYWSQRRLIVEFQNGQKYQYIGPGMDEVLGMVRASFVGSYFYKRIKLTYSGIRIEGE